MKNILNKIKSNEGSMLMLTLITITVLIILGVSALGVATTESKISSNEMNRQKALNLAESGIAHGSTITDIRNQATFNQTYSDGSSYSVTRTYTPATLEFYLVSSGTANEINKTIKTKYTLIQNLQQVKSTVIAENLLMQQTGSGSESKGEIEGGAVVANSQANITGNVKFENGADLLVGPEVNTSGLVGFNPNIMSSKYPVPQIDIKYYEKLAQGNIIQSGNYNLNSDAASHTNINGYDLYFADGDITVNANLANNNPAIVIATGNVSIQGQLGSANKPVLIYSGNNVTINGAGNINFEVQGVIIAKNSINITNSSEVKGTLIAPTVSITGSKWELEYNSSILDTSLMTNIKLIQNKKVATWIEEN